MKQPVSKLIAEFVDNLDIRSNSRSLYLRILRQFTKWVVTSGLDVKSLVRADILRYKADLLRRDLSENTIDSYLTVLRMFYDWLEAIGEHDNIAAGIRVKHKRKGFRKGHLTVDQITLLLNAIDRDTPCGRRDYALINLLLRTGMRCVEASRLRVRDIDSRQGNCYLSVQRKGDNDRYERIGTTHKAIGPVLDYLSWRGVQDDTEYVFMSHETSGSRPISAQGLGQIITGYLKKAGVHSRMITPHSLRHTAAVQALKAGVAVIDLQAMLGHRSIKTTEIYLKSVEDERRLDNPAGKVLDDIF